MSAYTPGPWWLAAPITRRSHASVVVSDDHIADVSDTSREAEAAANAHLIAAAPELLAALKALVDLLNDDMDPEQNAAWDAAVAAINKAEGETS